MDAERTDDPDGARSVMVTFAELDRGSTLSRQLVSSFNYVLILYLPRISFNYCASGPVYSLNKLRDGRGDFTRVVK